ncbi:hypothetical protein HHK36_014040 [Tetracentron sinense]|uniref:TFIIS central domain-containing protein n=1 Tax=Tetracentron sinense TaxID=13715 RepID=A0A834Z7H6_TETSI|nr:hypothetical protein HHK36_014040 [Tetracentron sinense]
MSNKFGSHQLTINNKQMGHLEPISNNLGSQQLSILNERMGVLEPMSNNLGSQLLSIPNKQLGQIKPMLNNPGLQQVLIPNKQMEQMEHMSNNPWSQQLATPNKLMASMEPMSNNLGWQQLSAPNKQTAHMQSMSNNPGSQHLSTPDKQAVQLESKSKKPGSQPNKRTAQVEPSYKGQSESFELVRSKLRESLAASLVFISQQQNKLSTVGMSSQSEVASTPKHLYKDTQQIESTSTTVDVASCHVSETPLKVLPSKDHDSAQKHNAWQSASQEILSNENTEDSSQTWKCDRQEFHLKHVLLKEDVPFSNNLVIKDDLLQGNGICWALGLDIEVVETKESQSVKRPKLLHEEVDGEGGEPAFRSMQTLAAKIEAELFKLFGGVNKKYKEKARSLLFNLKDHNNPELREKVMSGEISPERLCSMTAEELASKELSEWRIAKAEELAQMIVLPDSEIDIKRLVRKTHKGEFQVEFEQDDVSVEVAVGANSLTQIRSKTNEMEAQLPSKSNEIKTEVNTISERSNLQDQNLPCGLATLPDDATDLMQGFIVDELKGSEFLPPTLSLDEFMESLDSEPPFENLSVDVGQAIPISDGNKSSYVGSKLDSDLDSIDTADTTPNKPDKMEVKYTKTEENTKSSDVHIESETFPSGGASKGEHVWEGSLQLNISTMVTVIGFFKSGEKTSTREWPSSLEIKGRVRLDAFEKFLQELPMSRSRAIMVLSCTVKDTCSGVKIMYICLVQFSCKDGSPENGRESLCEVVDSYVVDGRVGFAEPAPGVELYFCPPHTRTLEMLGKHLPKDHIETLNATDNASLIGVVVWRKAHVTSIISPKSFSPSKRNLRKQYYTLRRKQEIDSNANGNVNATSGSPLPLGLPPSKPGPPSNDEPIDDVPPGFGPAAARDEDDLPEFDFVEGSNPSAQQFTQNPSLAPGMGSFHPRSRPHRPVEEMRDLIHMYGQSETSGNSLKWQHSGGPGVEVQPWNDDDDDDIPEWQPQPSQQRLPSVPPSVHNFLQPMLQPIMVNQNNITTLPPQQPSNYSSQPLAPLAAPHPMPWQPLQPSMNMIQGQQSVGVWWAPPSGSHGQSIQGNALLQPCHFVGQPNEGQVYETPGFGAGTDPRLRDTFSRNF